MTCFLLLSTLCVFVCFVLFFVFLSDFYNAAFGKCYVEVKRQHPFNSTMQAHFDIAFPIVRQEITLLEMLISVLWERLNISQALERHLASIPRVRRFLLLYFAFLSPAVVFQVYLPLRHLIEMGYTRLIP